MSQTSQAAIERKQLMGDRGVPVFRYMLIIQVVAALAVTQVEWLSSFKFEAVLFYAFLASWLLWAVGLPLLVRHISSNSVNDRVRLETRTALKKWVGKPLKVADYATTLSKRKKITGTAIAFDGEALYVVDQGEAVRVQPAEVVSWQWHVPDGQRVMLFGRARNNFGLTMDAAEANMAQASQEYDASGLTLAVRDLDKPTWRFNSNDKPTLERWHAILQQVVEGR